MITNLKSDERLDDLQINGYEIIQHPGSSVLEWMPYYLPILPV